MALIGYWPLNEDSGDTAFDYSGKDNHGSFGGSPSQGLSGILDSTSYGFDGSNDYVDCGDVSRAKNIKSISCWVKFDELSSRAQEIVSMSSSGSGVEILLYDSKLQYFVMDRNDSNNPSVSAAPVSELNTGEWYHVVGVHYGEGGNEFRIYLNRNLRGRNTTPSSITDEPSFLIGDWNEFDRKFNGKVMEVRAYDRPLTPSEIQYLHNISNRGLQTTSKKTS